MTTTPTDLELNRHLTEQLDWHWTSQLRPRLDGLTDEEYFWESVDGCWNVRRRDPSAPQNQPGSGQWTIDFDYPEPKPAPVTTIAWRLAHVIVGVFGARNASHFDGPPMDYQSFAYAGTASEALAQLDEVYAHWTAGVKKLTLDELYRPVGPAEGPWAESPMIQLVLHINREAIHHGAEVAVLRDLYAHRDARPEEGSGSIGA